MANVEKPIEIVAKKCFYRAVDFTSRDIFDLAVLLENEPETVPAHEDVLFAKEDDLRRWLGIARNSVDSEFEAELRVSRMRQQMQDGIDAIDATPQYARLKKTAIDSVMRFVRAGRSTKRRG